MVMKPLNNSTESSISFHLTNTDMHKELSFPVGLYTATINGIEPQGKGYRDLHWHEELQYTIALEGSMTMQVNGVDYRLNSGQGIFINKNLLHVSKDLTPDGYYFSIDHPDKILSYFMGSQMESEYVHPFTNNYMFTSVIFDGSEAWHAAVLDRLSAIRSLLTEKPDFYQYRTCLLLCENWLDIISHTGKFPMPGKGYVRRQERMQKMLSFIHTNYGQHILISDIANAANVSEGECSRTFREMIHESPGQYLLRYRISRAADLLSSSDMSVTTIAYETGFSDPSHLIQSFKKYLSLTPYEYRTAKKATN